MHRTSSLLLVVALTLPAAIAAQAPAANTTVSRVTLYRVLPGQGAAFNKDMKEHIIPVLEEQKKAGLIVSYGIFVKNTTEKEDDWSVGVTVTLANWGAVDGFVAKIEPITLKHYGSAEKRTEAALARSNLRRVVSSTWLTPYNPT